jgi:hypothetical protein
MLVEWERWLRWCCGVCAAPAARRHAINTRVPRRQDATPTSSIAPIDRTKEVTTLEVAMVEGDQHAEAARWQREWG